jgi:HD-GYP domain-containing protein (c-di-GMP phosphodiesterase class II)
LAGHIVPDEIKDRYFRRLQRLQNKKEDLFAGQFRQYVLRRRDGSSFPSEFFIVPYELGSEKGFSVFIRDVTEIREAEKQIERSHAELTESYDATLRGWSNALDLRDNETEGHTQRVTDYAMRLAAALDIPEGERIHIYRGALLHDIGKIGIPDRILLKPGPLSPQEWEVMRLHPVHAYNFLSKIPYLQPALDIPHHHHEKWDGSGYPDKLAGAHIPFAARMFALVDVWDALTSDRPYRKAWTAEQARDFIRQQSGIHFDPQIAEVWLALQT